MHASRDDRDDVGGLGMAGLFAMEVFDPGLCVEEGPVMKATFHSPPKLNLFVDLVTSVVRNILSGSRGT